MPDRRAMLGILYVLLNVRAWCHLLKKPSPTSTAGKLISVGTTSVERAKRELEHVVKSLSKAKLIKPTKAEPMVRNRVANVDLGKPVDLIALCEGMRNLIYEPEQFPAAIWRPFSDPKATVLVFASGKLIVAGNVGLDAIDVIENEIRKYT